MQERRDAMMEFDRKGQAWAQGTVKALAEGGRPAPRRRRASGWNPASLELIGDDVVERKILSSRLALAIQEKATWELNDLRLRMQHLEGGDELASADVLRPEALSQLLVEQWGGAELTPEAWALVQDVIQRHLLEHVPEAYKLTNEFLVGQGVMRDIDLSSRVRRGASAPAGRKPDSQQDAAANSADGGGGSGAGGRGTAMPAATGGAATAGATVGGHGGGRRRRRRP